MATDKLQTESAANNRGGTIAALFGEWVQSVRAYEAHPGCGDDPEWCELHNASEAIRLQLMATPANTVAELATKTHALLHFEMGGTKAHPLDFDRNGGTMTDDRPVEGLAADLVRLSPQVRDALAI